MQERHAAPPLTVSISSHDGWSSLGTAYAPIREQAERHGAEVLLIDGSHDPPPPPEAIGPGTRHVAMPGADITEMRMRGYRDAQAPIVAMTEDHCIVEPDWIDAILRAHAEHPDAAAIGGTSLNGSNRCLVDWASYYAGHSPFMAPLPEGPVPYITGVNISYKREPLHQALDRLGERAIETLINGELTEMGHRFYADHRIAVTHHQSRGYTNTLLLHYYAGRNFEGTRSMSHPGRALERAARAMTLPLPRVGKRFMTAYSKGEPLSRLLRVAPSLYVLEAAQCIGEAMGALTGPGRSADELH